MAVERDPRNGKWRYRKRITLADGRKVRIKGTPAINTKKAAEDAERAHIERVMNPGAQPRKEGPRFSEFGDEFLETYARNNNKHSEYMSKNAILKNHLEPAFGKKRMSAIGERDIERFKAAQLARGLSPKTVNNQLTVLRRMFVIAKRWELVDSMPNIHWLKAPKPEFDFLDFEEARRLVDGADGDWAAMATIGLKCGLRLGELLALRWEDVDLKAGRLVVRRAVARGVVGTTKSGRSREVPLSTEALRMLKAHRHLRGELVFCASNGKMLTKNQCRWPLWRACRRAGLRRIGWHVLRHTFASHLVMRGVPLKAIHELLGHATIEMTMRYAHLSPDVRRDAVNLLDEPREGHSWATRGAVSTK